MSTDSFNTISSTCCDKKPDTESVLPHTHSTLGDNHPTESVLPHTHSTLGDNHPTESVLPHTHSTLGDNHPTESVLPHTHSTLGDNHPTELYLQYGLEPVLIDVPLLVARECCGEGRLGTQGSWTVRVAHARHPAPDDAPDVRSKGGLGSLHAALQGLVAGFTHTVIIVLREKGPRGYMLNTW